MADSIAGEAAYPMSCWMYVIPLLLFATPLCYVASQSVSESIEAKVFVDIFHIFVGVLADVFHFAQAELKLWLQHCHTFIYG